MSNESAPALTDAAVANQPKEWTAKICTLVTYGPELHADFEYTIDVNPRLVVGDDVNLCRCFDCDYLEIKTVTFDYPSKTIEYRTNDVELACYEGSKLSDFKSAIAHHIEIGGIVSDIVRHTPNGFYSVTADQLHLTHPGSA